MPKRSNDVADVNRWFLSEIVEVNGEMEYRKPVFFAVPAGQSCDRVTTMVQVDCRYGVPDEVIAAGDEAVDEYLAGLPWERDGEPGESSLWFDETVCQPVSVGREIDEAAYRQLCEWLG